MNHNSLPKNWILVRGLIRSKFHWNDFAQSLQSATGAENVFTVELPGNGYLSAESTPLSLTEVIKSFESQIPAMTEPAGLIGISLGGMLATAWAQIRPEKISHLALINSSSGESPFYQRLKPKNYLKIAESLIFNNPVKTEEFILSITSNDEGIWKKYLHSNIEFLKNHPVSNKNFSNQMKLASIVDFTDVPLPRKLILTSKADRLVSYKCSEKIAGLWQAKILYHETAGHDLPLDDANWVAEAIKAEFSK